MGRRRDVVPLVGWIVGLIVGVALFHGLGSGPLSPPPLTDPSAWSDWASQREPLVAVMALGRLVVLALAWYLVGATSIGLVARLARAARVVRVADALTVPALRRLLQASLGLGLATAVVGASTITPVHPTVERPAQAIEAADHGGDGSSPSARAPLLPADESATRIAPVVDGWPPLVGAAPILPHRPADAAPTPRISDESTSDDAVPAGDAVPVTGQRPDAMRPLPLELLLPSGSDQQGAGDAVADVPDAAADVPDAVADVPDAVADVPDAVADVPDAVADVPDAVADLPDAASAEAAGDGDPAGADLDGDPAEADLDGASTEADRDGDHLVVAGDSLWRIAHDALQTQWGRAPTDGEVLPYWGEVIEANRDRLADPDDPDLIFPGQRLTVPPLPAHPGSGSGGGS